MQFSSMKMCPLPSSSVRWVGVVPFCRHEPDLLAVVSLQAVLRRVPGTKFLTSLQMWPVEELSHTKKIESVSNGT